MKKLYLLPLLVLLALGCSEDAENFEYSNSLMNGVIKSMNMPRPKDSYNYPTVPGTKKWKGFDSRQQKVNACQVPKIKLKGMSTQAVIQALWEYPLMMDYIAWENPQKGYDFVFEELNAFQELKTRKDAPYCFLERLRVVEIASSDYPFAHYAIQMHMAQPQIIEGLTKQQTLEALERSVYMYEIRQSLPNFREASLNWYTNYFISRCIEKIDKEFLNKKIDNRACIRHFIDTFDIDYDEWEQTGLNPYEWFIEITKEFLETQH